MRLLIAGGGPTGLYLAISMLQRSSSHQITVLERNRPDDTFGWGVVFSDATLDNLTENDPKTADEIRGRFTHWDDIEVHFRGRKLLSGGHGFCGIGRKRLLRILQRRASELGADLRFDEPVIEWSASASGVRIRTERGEYPARRLAIAAGAWTPQLLPGLPLPLEVERTVQYWFEPAGEHTLALPDGPAWVWELEREGTWYGFPPTARGLKAGMHFQAGRGTAVERVDREVGAAETEALRRLFGRYAPGVAGALTHASVCLYTNTPDEDFILDRHPDRPAVVLFAGGSGHAFKFAPVLGSLMADLLTDHPSSRDLPPLSIDRFR